MRSSTPRTDAWEKETVHHKVSEHAYCGWKRARQLERELNAALESSGKGKKINSPNPYDLSERKP